MYEGWFGVLFVHICGESAGVETQARPFSEERPKRIQEIFTRTLNSEGNYCYPLLTFLYETSLWFHGLSFPTGWTERMLIDSFHFSSPYVNVWEDNQGELFAIKFLRHKYTSSRTEEKNEMMIFMDPLKSSNPIILVAVRPHGRKISTNYLNYHTYMYHHHHQSIFYSYIVKIVFVSRYWQ